MELKGKRAIVLGGTSGIGAGDQHVSSHLPARA